MSLAKWRGPEFYSLRANHLRMWVVPPLVCHSEENLLLSRLCRCSSPPVIRLTPGDSGTGFYRLRHA